MRFVSPSPTVLIRIQIREHARYNTHVHIYNSVRMGMYVASQLPAPVLMGLIIWVKGRVLGYVCVLVSVLVGGRLLVCV